MKKLPKNSKTKKFAEQELSKPPQLTFWDLMNADKEDYSHTIKLYGIMPTKVYSKVPRVEGQYLPSFERNFVYQKEKYSIKVRPARITAADGTDLDAYMGKREELVEDALLKLAADGRANAVYLDNQFTVIFTRNVLQKELEEQGHTYSYQQIEEAIDILFNSSVEIRREGESDYDKFHPVESYGIRGRNGETYTYVKFSPQVTASIENNSYRLVNYRKLMAYTSTIARLLHKKMAHSYVHADDMHKYHFSVNSIYRDFGLNKKLMLRHRLAEVKAAVEELVASKVIADYECKPILNAQKKNKNDDHVFEVVPHQEFINDVIKANKDHKRRVNEMNIQKFLPNLPLPKK